MGGVEMGGVKMGMGRGEVGVMVAHRQVEIAAVRTGSGVGQGDWRNVDCVARCGVLAAAQHVRRG